MSLLEVVCSLCLRQVGNVPVGEVRLVDALLLGVNKHSSNDNR